jgi:hypothetical protein
MVKTVCNALSKPARPAKRLERFLLENVAREYAALYVQLREDTIGMRKD